MKQLCSPEICTGCIHVMRKVLVGKPKSLRYIQLVLADIKKLSLGFTAKVYFQNLNLKMILIVCNVFLRLSQKDEYILLRRQLRCFRNLIMWKSNFMTMTSV